VAARPLLEEIGRLGFSRVELNAQLPRYLLDSVAEEAARAGFLVGSLHNFCPAPPAGEEGDSLASAREKIRARAVRNTVLTVEAAARLGASAVVLHLGLVPPRRSARRLQAWTERGLAGTPKYLRLRDRVLARRARLARPCLERVVRSLRELAPPAEALGVRLGLETRYHPWEIPSFPEIGEILEEVGSPALGYWHDLGHARVRETLGDEPALSYLERYGKRLIGMHIHDVVVTRDHKAPGEGEMDFSPYRPWLAANGIHKVFEVHPGATPEQIIRGRVLLENLVGA